MIIDTPMGPGWFIFFRPDEIVDLPFPSERVGGAAGRSGRLKKRQDKDEKEMFEMISAALSLRLFD